jgi:glycerol-3-phosphate dehydrogenase
LDSAMQRDVRQLSRNRYDVLVLGAGIYGAWTAWDAALRGLSVALVDKGDFGHATSSNTLRIIHGGFRYLQHGDIRRMRHSIYERRVLMQVAPHLVQPLPFLIPTYGRGMRGKELLSVALRINDLVGYDRNRLSDPGKHLPRGRVISRQECLRRFPGVDAEGLTGGAICFDGQVSSSERLLLAIVRSATNAGADVANYVEAVTPVMARDRLVGITAKDMLTGDEFDIRAQMVVNTTGPWLARVSSLLSGHRTSWRLPLSKAFNLLIDRQLVPEYAVGAYGKSHFEDQDALLRKGSRLFFITPWHGRSLIGTAHLPYHADPDSFSVSEGEIQAFLDEINEAYPAARLHIQDVSFVYGGLLPAAEARMDSAQLLKRHHIRDHSAGDGLTGLISVLGVKFTEARYVAEKAVDLVFRKLGRPSPPSATATTPLHGGEMAQFHTFLAHEVARSRAGLPAEVLQRLIAYYGSAYTELINYLDHPAESPPPLTAASRILRAEVLHGIREEMAQTLVDLVARRIPPGVAESPGTPYLRTCAAIMAKELRWDEARMQRELEEVQGLTSHKRLQYVV